MHIKNNETHTNSNIWSARKCKMKKNHTSLSPIRRGFAPGFVNYKKGCTRLAAASDKVYQLLAHGRWLSPGTPVSSTTKTGFHDIAVQNIAENGVQHQKSNQIIL